LGFPELRALFKWLNKSGVGCAEKYKTVFFFGTFSFFFGYFFFARLSAGHVPPQTSAPMQTGLGNRFTI